MQRWQWSLVVLMLGLAALGCAVTNPLTRGDDDLQAVSDLWGDVPRMDGLTPSDRDMPVLVKVIVRSTVSRLLSGGTGTGDWILFTTPHTTDDVKDFYTNARMAEHGWEASDTSTCVTGSAEGLADAGLICVFQKQEGSTYTGLAIIGTAAEDAGQTNVIFVRIEGEQTPEP